jgi:hypothetical protein
MKLIYKKKLNEYYTYWVKIRANTNLVIEGGDPRDPLDRMTAEFGQHSLCGMTQVTELYVGNCIGTDWRPAVEALKAKLSDYPTIAEVEAL